MHKIHVNGAKEKLAGKKVDSNNGEYKKHHRHNKEHIEDTSERLKECSHN
jgi:hypothetical protein